jgi:hypothetical protein
MEMNAHTPAHGSISNTLFPGINLYLLQRFQDLIGQANVNDREVQRNNRYYQQTTNNPLHEDLRFEIKFRQSYIQNERELKLNSADHSAAFSPCHSDRIPE